MRTAEPPQVTPATQLETPHDVEMAGLDSLELAAPGPPHTVARVWRATWPKVAAFTVALGLWQLVAWSGWKPPYVLPGPVPVLGRLWSDLTSGQLVGAVGLTLRRAVTGFALAALIGSVVGLTVARWRILRIAIGSLLTGLQTMPSIAWFPLAIPLFTLSEKAILFVVVLGAAPSIANGIINGVNTVPPLLDRVATVLGAGTFARFRHVIIPAAMPSILGGLKQGWAFAWRSLMAGELLVIIAGRPSIGTLLQNARDLSDTEWLMATMISILVIGIVVDSAFGAVERAVLERRGLGTS